MTAGDSSIQVTLRDVVAIWSGLQRYDKTFRSAAASAKQTLTRVQAEFQMKVVLNEKQLREHERAREGAELALQRCREDCSRLQESLRRCRAAELAARHTLDRSRAALRQYEAAASDLLRTIGTASESTETNVRAATGNLLAYAEDLERYLRTQ